MNSSSRRSHRRVCPCFHRDKRFNTPTNLIRLGAQWGDEGKGKLVDILAAEADICARCAGGNNAGHTIVVRNPKGEKISYAFNLLPSGEYLLYLNQFW
jgi:adenylosuccinate synthase